MAIKIGDQVYITAREAAKVIGVNRVKVGYFLQRNELDGILDVDDYSMILPYLDNHELPFEEKVNKTFLIPLESAIKKRFEMKGKKNG